MKKRLVSTLLALCMALALLPGMAQAAATSGTCGDNLTWSYSNGTLTIQGTGDMDGSSYSSEIPWYDYHEQIHTVNIGNGVTSIGRSAFYGCSSLTSVTIPDSVTIIGIWAFGHCDNLASVTIPNSVTIIDDDAFGNCSSLTSVTIPDSVTRIGVWAFDSCSSLTSVTIPDSVTSIGYDTFRDCSSLTSITIPNSVTSIGDSAFHNCSSLTSITIPDSVTRIGVGAFWLCESLTSVTIPRSVTRIGQQAFQDCNSLKDIYYEGSESQWSQISIGYLNDPLLNATIHYNSNANAEPEHEDNASSNSDPGNSVPSNNTPSVAEHIYDTPNPGEDVMLDANRLNSVTDPATAAEAVRDMVGGMSQEQKESPTGIDLATLYAETAVAKAASKPVTSPDILINAANVTDLAAEAAQTLSAVEDALANSGITTARYLSKTVTLTTSETNITIRIDPDVLGTDVDKVRVEAPDYALTFKLSDLASDLTSSLTFKAALTNTETLSVANAVDIEVPGGSMANSITVSLPTDKSTDTTYQAVVSSSGIATASKYNPATTDIDGKINASGTYTIKSNEKDFTDIANKSAEMQKAIRYLASKGIIEGTTATTFSPDGSISRAELTKLVVSALGKVDSKAAPTFTDVTTANWFYAIAASSQKLGYITGFEDNTFRGTTTINKEQIVVIAARVLSSEMNYKTPSNTATYLSKYSDTVVSWAQPQVALATRENLVVYRTDGTFSGAKNMTRGDAAIIIYRLFQRIW